MTRYSNLAETTKVAATAYSYDHAEQDDRNRGFEFDRRDARNVRLYI